MPLFNKTYGGYHKHLSQQHLEKFTRDGDLRAMLRWLAHYDVQVMHHSFNDVTVANLGWAVANSGGAGAVNLAIPSTKLVNGLARMESGTTNNGSASAIHYTQWNGDQNVFFQTRIKLDAVTAYNLEVGLIDAVPAANGSGVSDVDTPAATMTDGALLQIDTSQTLTTLAFVTAGTTFTTTATTLASPGPTGLTAAAYMTVAIQLIGNVARCFVNGIQVANHTGDKVEGGNLLAPWFYIRTRNTVTKKLDVDYVLMAQDRA